ncbi:MAG: deoxyguanosinetriphosphate triphosphohydrolase [Clostridia bacterium]|nr:deoxyguanosinetriphosphate triphosphohydrolase [Clostridia bacterium]MBQ9879526.1 deoxyguanosinetriphosphate triphosphohydrolase [Clostridia bacterium]
MPDGSIRERTLEMEHATLAEYASFCDRSRGRAEPEEECPVRTAWQRDRDRIVHCASFRRLMGKTQVFLSPEGDHYRTRLTHTLEVTQIARTIARAVRLNEDLTEAIALGHDLGHTPFGHAGERALDHVFPDGFAHYRQSLRVVDRLEKNGEGLNLTFEVRNGILCHTKGEEAVTPEGRLVKLADKIAYINHDIDDAQRAGVISETDIPLEIRKLLGSSKAQRVNSLVISAIENSGEEIRLSDECRQALDELSAFMFANVYFNPVCKGEEGKAEALVKKLYIEYSEHPEKLPPLYAQIARNETPARAAVDYISGMTDRYAMSHYSRLFIPGVWEY